MIVIDRDEAGATDDGEAHMDQLLYTIAQCCRMAAIGRTKFYELISTGDIPVRKIGKKTLVVASDLHDWIQRLPALKVKAVERTDVKAASRRRRP
jgi:excisionase family DNA binding protein